jgi:hypothetical protein
MNGASAASVETLSAMTPPSLGNFFAFALDLPLLACCLINFYPKRLAGRIRRNYQRSGVKSLRGMGVFIFDIGKKPYTLTGYFTEAYPDNLFRRSRGCLGCDRSDLGVMKVPANRAKTL